MRGRGRIGAGAAVLALAVTAHAQDAATFPPGGIPEALKARVGKPAVLHLTTGTTLGGTIAEVRDHTVLVKQITGRELSDALVRLDHVAAVEIRARER